MHIVTIFPNTGGHTYTRCCLHEPEASAEIYKDHIPDRGRSCGHGEGRSEAHTQGSLQKPKDGPLRPHRRLSGRARCKDKFITVKRFKKHNSSNIYLARVSWPSSELPCIIDLK